MRGIARQLSLPNFVQELLDIRVMVDARRRGVDWNGPFDENLMVDITQDSRYQIAGGNVSMLGGSRIFVFDKDRTARPEDNLIFDGWGDDVDTDCVDVDIMASFRSEARGTQLKKTEGEANHAGDKTA